MISGKKRAISWNENMHDVRTLLYSLQFVVARQFRILKPKKRSEFPHLRKKSWGRHLWARGYLAVSSGNITDEMIQQYIEEQEGEPVTDDSRFPSDPS